MTIATMLMKYEEQDEEAEELGPDQFQKELSDIGLKIFGEQHKSIVDFIIEQESVKIDPGAQKHLMKEKPFFQKFF
jgi:hypothetical protein